MIQFSSEEKVEIETKSASDQNYDMPFLRSEFYKKFCGPFTVTLFTKLSHNNDQTKACLLESSSN